MKSIYLTFDDNDFSKVERIKKQFNLTWEKFILELIKCLAIKRKENE